MVLFRGGRLDRIVDNEMAQGPVQGRSLTPFPELQQMSRQRGQAIRAGSVPALRRRRMRRQTPSSCAETRNHFPPWARRSVKRPGPGEAGQRVGDTALDKSALRSISLTSSALTTCTLSMPTTAGSVRRRGSGVRREGACRSYSSGVTTRTRANSYEGGTPEPPPARWPSGVTCGAWQRAASPGA